MPALTLQKPLSDTAHPHPPTWMTDVTASELDILCQPYVPLLRQVMLGERFKAVFHFEPGFFLGDDALLVEDSTAYQRLVAPVTFQFFHGCLMGRIYYQGNGYAFPPLHRNSRGELTWRVRSQGDMASQQEFLRLPQAILNMFFNLLKLTFLQEPILCPVEQPVIHYSLQNVHWKTR